MTPRAQVLELRPSLLSQDAQRVQRVPRVLEFVLSPAVRGAQGDPLVVGLEEGRVEDPVGAEAVHDPLDAKADEPGPEVRENGLGDGEVEPQLGLEPVQVEVAGRMQPRFSPL